jgi:hypothetical protein
MMSCIFVFYISVFAPFLALAVQAPSEAAHGPSADDLYARRDDLASARQAEAVWQQRLAGNARDFDAAWKLARTRYWLGGHAPPAERKALLEAGIAAGRAAARAQPDRPEGYFWTAANMGALAESFGLRQGLKYRGDIKDQLLRALAIDPAYQEGSADRALGRWYFKVPAIFGGSKKKSEEHLRRSLTYNAQSTISRFFLAETLLGMDRRAEAMQELQKVMDAPYDPAWAPEDREYKARAQRLLQTLRQRR